ncbi:MAG TPA: metal ABC transporter permease [Hyphomicrobiaceae bacterium]|nr:metal ABC transporter permease [Hyphomicrobiaceae bacterium]
MLEPFLARALAAGIGLAIVAAPFGCIVVWNRMAYFGEAVAQAGLLGVALGLMLAANQTLAVILVTLAVAGLLILGSRQSVLPMDSILGLTHHGALALGVIAMSMLRGPPVDLMGYLFGDIFAVTDEDLYWVFGGGAVVLAVVARLWQPLLRIAVHDEIAAAEGVGRERVKAAFIVLLALFVAIAIKIVGVLLVIAFLIVPAVAARPLAATPERMALLAGLFAIASVLAGIGLSVGVDAPGGPSIVLVMAIIAGLSLACAASGRRN